MNSAVGDSINGYESNALPYHTEITRKSRWLRTILWYRQLRRQQ